MSGAKPCMHCKRLVVVRALRNGSRRPFDRKLLPANQVGEPARYVPVKSGGEVVMVPAADMAPNRLVVIRWFAVMHACAEGLRAWRERNDAAGIVELQTQLLAALGIDVDQEMPETENAQ